MSLWLIYRCWLLGVCLAAELNGLCLLSRGPTAARWSSCLPGSHLLPHLDQCCLALPTEGFGGPREYNVLHSLHSDGEQRSFINSESWVVALALKNHNQLSWWPLKLCGAFLLIHKRGSFRQRPQRWLEHRAGVWPSVVSLGTNPNLLVRLCLPLKTHLHTHPHVNAHIHSACVHTHAHTPSHTSEVWTSVGCVRGPRKPLCRPKGLLQIGCSEMLLSRPRLPLCFHHCFPFPFKSQRHLPVP